MSHRALKCMLSLLLPEPLSVRVNLINSYFISHTRIWIYVCRGSSWDSNTTTFKTMHKLNMHRVSSCPCCMAGRYPDRVHGVMSLLMARNIVPVSLLQRWCQPAPHTRTITSKHARPIILIKEKLISQIFHIPIICSFVKRRRPTESTATSSTIHTSHHPSIPNKRIHAAVYHTHIVPRIIAIWHCEAREPSQHTIDNSDDRKDTHSYRLLFADTTRTGRQLYETDWQLENVLALFVYLSGHSRSVWACVMYTLFVCFSAAADANISMPVPERRTRCEIRFAHIIHPQTASPTQLQL